MSNTQDNILLRLENIEKGFGGTEVLRNINLAVARGEFITLLGSSGCGKTTTLRIIAGLEVPDGGRVYLDGQDVTDWEPNKRDVNTVFQSYALFPHMSVQQNVAYSLKLKRVPAAEAKRQVAEALELVQLTGFEDRMPGELSGGQRQRVAIARAVVSQPKVLLLDEPLGALDLQLRRQMQHELKQLQQKLGITFIYITHDQEEALTMSDRIAVMRDGGFEQIGTAAEVYDKPKTAFVARFVGSANVIPDGAGGWVAVRGEHVELVPEGGEAAEGTNGVEAVVEQKSFAGGMLRVSVRAADGTEIVATRHGIDWRLEPGQQVYACWQPQYAVPVEGDDTTAIAPPNATKGEVEAG